MTRQVVVGTYEKKMLEEILLRLRALQDALDQNEIETILRDARYREALREAEADIESGRERPLEDFLKGLRKKT